MAVEDEEAILRVYEQFECNTVRSQGYTYSVLEGVELGWVPAVNRGCERSR